MSHHRRYIKLSIEQENMIETLSILYANIYAVPGLVCILLLLALVVGRLAWLRSDAELEAIQLDGSHGILLMLVLIHGSILGGGSLLIHGGDVLLQLHSLLLVLALLDPSLGFGEVAEI